MSDEEKKAWDNLIMLKYFTMEKEDKQAIDTILNLIEKQSKEIEELKEDNKELKKYYATRKEVEELREINACLHDSADDYVHKDKIREILEYYAHTPLDNPDTIIAFYSDINKLLEE